LFGMYMQESSYLNILSLQPSMFVVVSSYVLYTFCTLLSISVLADMYLRNVWCLGLGVCVVFHLYLLVAYVQFIMPYLLCPLFLP
jgi:hypothetical protein